MIRLQGLYDTISQNLQDRQSPPSEVKALEETNRRRQAELVDLEAQIAQRQEELREIHKGEEEWRLELEHFQKQKSMVTNEREFTAVISEIDYATKELETKKTRHEELEKILGELAEEIENRKQARPEEEAAQKEITEGWENTKKDLKAKVHQLASDAASIEEELNPKNRALFHRLLKSKKGIAIAAVADGSCSVCHFKLRPHLMQRVRRCEEIIPCEFCHRILYREDALSENDIVES
jgi:predicted  nucleic acid-binding Zn-ribbon protein